jgi:hypothetical protein
MTNAIVRQLEGLEKLEAVKVLVAALHTVTEGMRGEDLPGIVPIVQRLVPIKKMKDDPYAPVWAYLETIPEYTNGKELRAELVARFGEAGTPCLSNLYKYLRTRGKK